MQADLELTTAHRAVQLTEKTIAALYKKFGDDTDKRLDYQAAEDRRDRALDLRPILARARRREWSRKRGRSNRWPKTPDR